MFDRGVGRNGFQTAEITAVTALTQRLNLNMTNLTDVAIATDENAAIGNNSRAGSAVHSHQNGVFAILACPEIVLSQRQAANIVTNKAGNFEAFFERFDQSPVFDLNVWHIADDAAFRIDKAWQDDRNCDQLADFPLTALNKDGNGVEQRIFQRFLGALRERVMLFGDHFTAHIIESERRIVATQAYANGVEIAGFCDDRDSAAAPGGGLLIDFFDQPAFDQLTRNFGYAGGGKLALLGNLNSRDWPMLVNQAINRRAVKLFYEINITYLSLSAWCHSFSYSVTTSLPLTMVLIILKSCVNAVRLATLPGAMLPSCLSTPMARAG